MLGAVHLTGTLVNVAAVLVGTAIGVLLGDRLPERVREIVMHTLGLFVISLGVFEAAQAFTGPLAELARGSAVVVLLSLLVGGVIGQLLRIDEGLNRLGDALRRRFQRRAGADGGRFVEGFVVASLVFCVGPLTVLGAIQDGLSGDSQLLIVKSVLDGFAALAFAAALGWGVGFAALTILVYQGALSLAAGLGAGAFSPAMISAMTAVGGVMILAIGLRLLELKTIRIANLLPALALAPATVAVIQAVR